MLRRGNSNNNSDVPSSAMSRQPSGDYGAVFSPNSNESNYRQLSQSFRANPGFRGSTDPLRAFARRTSSFGSTSFPSHHRSPVQIIVLDAMAPPRDPNPNPWPRHALPRPIDHWHYPLRQPEDYQYSRMSSHNVIEQQNKALENLKKEQYFPNSKRLIKTVNLYYRDTPVNPRDLDNEEEGKRCAICLEDFERGQEVMLTPCKHMFHEDCIVTWARSNPQCPVCRAVFGPKARESSSALPFNNNNNSGVANTGNPGLSTEEFLSILRALGDGFHWG